jgi:hypothetical protein
MENEEIDRNSSVTDSSISRMKSILSGSAARMLYLGLALVGFSGELVAESELVQVVDKQGRAMSARLISSDGTTLTFVRNSDSKEFSVPLTALSDATQTLVSEWVESGGSLVEKYEVTVDTAKNRRKKGGEDFDDKRVNLTPFITVKNPDPKIESREAKVTVVFLGRPVESNTDMFVFRAQEFELPQLKPLGSRTFDMAEISQAYDSRGYAQFGSRYLGYVVLVHEEGGKRIYDAKSVPAFLATTFGAKFLKVQTGKTYDRDLKMVPGK